MATSSKPAKAYFRNAEISQMISSMTTTTAMTPTHTPALKIPSIAVQLLRHIRSDKINGRCNFFMVDFYGYVFTVNNN